MSSRQVVPGPMYLDSSAMVRLIIPLQASQELSETLRGRSDVFLSDLGITEYASALGRLKREGRLTAEELEKAMQEIQRLCTHGPFTPKHLTAAIHIATRKRLTSAHGVQLRTADSLHLQLALAARCQTMVTFDRRLAEASREAGLAVFPALPGLN